MGRARERERERHANPPSRRPCHHPPIEPIPSVLGQRSADVVGFWRPTGSSYSASLSEERSAILWQGRLLLWVGGIWREGKGEVKGGRGGGALFKSLSLVASGYRVTAAGSDSTCPCCIDFIFKAGIQNEAQLKP